MLFIVFLIRMLFWRYICDWIIIMEVRGVMKLYFSERFSVWDFSWIFLFLYFDISNWIRSFLIFLYVYNCLVKFLIIIWLGGMVRLLMVCDKEYVIGILLVWLVIVIVINCERVVVLSLLEIISFELLK